MDLINIEFGPWGSVVFIAFVILSVMAILWTSWIVSGIAFSLLVLLPIAVVVYVFGCKAKRRAIHGRRRS